jgi:hypothetical protein
MSLLNSSSLSEFGIVPFWKKIFSVWGIKESPIAVYVAVAEEQRTGKKLLGANFSVKSDYNI